MAATSAGRDFAFNALRITEERVNKVMRAVGIEVLKRVIERTPVDTGRARANWNAATNTEDGSVNEGATLADVAAALQKGAAHVGSVDFFTGEVLYVCNGLPYIMQLEDGSSTQAPAGMVGVTIEEMRAFAEKIANDLGRGDR